MAGYIFALSSEQALEKIIKEGVYSTNLSKPKYVKSHEKYQWSNHHEATFGDYFSMKEGDNVYFFIKRKIYGVGELVNIKGDCIKLNYPNALNPEHAINNVDSDIKIYLGDNEAKVNPLVCFFKPSPYFFKQGVDMDDVLASNPPAFRMLRAFWKLSFIKVDDEENQALKSIIIKRNQEFLNNPDNDSIFYIEDKIHSEIDMKINQDYSVDDVDIIKSASHKGYKDYIRHEMAIESSLIYNLSKNDKHITNVFGKWDYISHQVVASPFKAIDYMDKMDIFGYKYIPGFNIISNYLIIELKKDSANIDTVDQVMKYVDWVSQEYSFNDYSMIIAYIVAYDIPKEVIDYAKKVAIRNFTKGSRPTTTETWSNLRLIKYKRVGEDIQYIEIK